MGSDNRERAAAELGPSQKHRRLRRVGSVLLGMLVVIGVGYGVTEWTSDPKGGNPDAPEKTVTKYAYIGAHVDRAVVYSETPPVAGAHSPRWQTCGSYPAPIRSEHAVHSLEHGAVWITYDPALPREDVDRLETLADEQDYVLVSPFPGLPAPVVASSWNNQIVLDGAGDPDLVRFLSIYKQGPDTPELGAPCTNGVSTVGE